MKNSILIIAALLGLFLASCKSAVQKETAAKENVSQAQQNLQETRADNNADWLVFKADAEAKILDNEKRIAEIKTSINKPGSTFDGMRRTKIEKLEAKNAELKQRLNNYDGNQTQWQTFKNDFNREANELGKNIKNIFD